MDTYTLTVGTVTRLLPIVRVSPTRSIPLIEMLGDFELTNAVADALVGIIPPETEMLFTVETSGVALGHAVAERMGLPYKVARRHRRSYFKNPLIQEVEGMTLGVHETLWLDGRHAEELVGKKTAILADVVVSGSTNASLARLVERAGGQVLGYYAGIVQGEPSIPVHYIHKLPARLEPMGV